MEIWPFLKIKWCRKWTHIHFLRYLKESPSITSFTSSSLFLVLTRVYKLVWWSRTYIPLCVMKYHARIWTYLISLCYSIAIILEISWCHQELEPCLLMQIFWNIFSFQVSESRMLGFFKHHQARFIFCII